MSSKQLKKLRFGDIPRSDAPNALSVTDGGTTVGTIIAHDGEFFSFDNNGELLGEYKTQREALRAIPPAAK